MAVHDATLISVRDELHISDVTAARAGKFMAQKLTNSGEIREARMPLERLPLLTWFPALPLLLWQGRRVKRGALRLPEAAGNPYGHYAGSRPAIRLHILGESPVCGVGVDHYDDSLGAQIARELARISGQAVHWHAHGINGIRLAQFNSLERADRDADLVIVSFGVNDTTGLTRRARWRDGLHRLMTRLPPVPVVFLPVPPIQDFPLLPAPLRHFLGQRARQLDTVLRQFCQARANAHYAEIQYELTPTMLARDGYHPSEIACAQLARALAPQLLRQLNPRA